MLTLTVPDRAEKRFSNGSAQPKQGIRTHKALVFIILLALAIRLAFFMSAQPWDDDSLNYILREGDPSQYHQQALSFANHGFSLLFSDEDPAYGGRTPGYALFLTAIYFPFGERVWLALLAQLFLNVGTVGVVYFLAKELFTTKRVATLAALLYSLSFISARWAATEIFTETLFAFVLALAALALVRALKKNALRWYSLAGLLVGFGALIRPVLEYGALIVILVILLRQNSLRLKFLSVVAFAAVFMLTLSPWQVRHYVLYDHYKLSLSGANHVVGEAIVFKKRRENISEIEAGKSILQLEEGLENPFDIGAIQQRRALRYIFEHPFGYARQHFKGVFAMAIGTEKGVILYKLLHLQKPYSGIDSLEETFVERVRRVIRDLPEEYYLTPITGTKLLLEYAFFAIGLAIMIARGMKLYALFFVLMILYIMFVPGAIGYNLRYKVPVIPLYIAVAGAGLDAAWRWGASKGWLRLKPKGGVDRDGAVQISV